ncbi:MAG: type II toxin-antitoxin system prevent-host-death family antitoxin [Mesorhizobium sp.]|nr:type II toxin-antitoxin system prevent-host-death family antitoxin [Mesorhizobium sp.]MCO5161747.1 type II toxin-antitoxin system prevent-host-death family antitoxin [Mesorhizobium sp.]
MQLREAKAGLSAIVLAAEKGEPTIITKHGKATAMVVPIEEARKLYPSKAPNLGEFLLTFPGGLELERDTTPMRDVDL